MSEMTGARIRLGFILCYPVNYIAESGEEDDGGGKEAWSVESRLI